MKDLKDFSNAQLREELRKREENERMILTKKLPDINDCYSYMEVEGMILNGKNKNFQIFHAHIDDGCEGFGYLVKLIHDEFDRTDEMDDMIENTVKHAVLSKAIDQNWINNLYDLDITIREIEPYGLDYLIINRSSDEVD